jgi:hypothetical protein
MSPSCASCGRDVPDFVRVCEHCGEPVAVQRQLPAFAESLRAEYEYEDELQPDFDFATLAPESTLKDEADSYVELYDEPTPATPVMVPVPAVELVTATEPQVAEKSEPAHVPGVLFGAEEQKPPRRSRRREFAFATLVIGVGGALTFAAMRGNGDTQLNALREPQGVLSSSKDANALTATAPAAEKPAPPPPAAEPAPAPAPAVAPAPAGGRWNAGNPAWAGTSTRTVAFEIEANNIVSIWMRSVRPTLVVRCTAGKVEAFVYTSSAARIEPGSDDHTVRYSFDSGHETEQRWRDSEEHDALFAPDGDSIARRLMDANMFRFVFTPHNAAPASAHFSVAGLRQLIESQRNCQAK